MLALVLQLIYTKRISLLVVINTMFIFTFAFFSNGKLFLQNPVQPQSSLSGQRLILLHKSDLRPSENKWQFSVFEAGLLL